MKLPSPAGQWPRADLCRLDGELAGVAPCPACGCPAGAHFFDLILLTLDCPCGGLPTDGARALYWKTIKQGFADAPGLTVDDLRLIKAAKDGPQQEAEWEVYFDKAMRELGLTGARRKELAPFVMQAVRQGLPLENVQTLIGVAEQLAARADAIREMRRRPYEGQRPLAATQSEPRSSMGPAAGVEAPAAPPVSPIKPVGKRRIFKPGGGA